MNDEDPPEHHYIASPYCPTCGSPTAMTFSPEWLLAHFKGIFADILTVLIQARRESYVIPIDHLTTLVYQRRARPMPENAQQVMHNAVSLNRKKLVSLGWSIMVRGHGLKGYLLVPLEPETQPEHLIDRKKLAKMKKSLLRNR